MQTEEGRHFVLLCWRGGRCCAGGGWWLVLQHEWLGSLASTLEHFARHQMGCESGRYIFSWYHLVMSIYLRVRYMVIRKHSCCRLISLQGRACERASSPAFWLWSRVHAICGWRCAASRISAPPPRSHRGNSQPTTWKLLLPVVSTG